MEPPKPSTKHASAVRRRRERLAVEPPPLWPAAVQGGKLVKMLQRTVQRLRTEESASQHGNRGLFLDDVFVAYLLAFFNPSIRTLRTIEDFSQTRQAQRHLSTPRICKSTLSDFHRLVDPQRLAPLIDQLRARLQRKFPVHERPAELSELLPLVLAVDGTFFAAAADVAWAVGTRNQHAVRRRARLDVQLDVHTWLPEVIAVPEPRQGEAHCAASTIQPGAIHVYDRGFGSFELIAAHYERSAAAEASPRAQFVLRCKSHQLRFEANETRPLEAAERTAGVASDRLGRLIGSPGHPAPSVTLREVVLARDEGEPLRLLTNLTDVPAETIGQLYRQRWQIELFFRWLKCYANFDHLISHDRRGVLLHFYVVVIGVMLMYLHTGYRPSKYAAALLSTAVGGGDLDDLLPILRERERQCELARRSAQRRRAKKKLERR
jgi:hypothetical protein